MAVNFILDGGGVGISVYIDDNCKVGMGCLFICVAHDIGPTCCRAANNQYMSIEVGRGVWIGARSTILPGVSIGPGCVIAAGSMVVDDCEPNCMYGGVPARLLNDFLNLACSI